MEIIESWEDHNGNCYAIVRWSRKERQGSGQKEYEALWLDENTNPETGLCSFGGTVGFKIADFENIEDAQDFLLEGISLYDEQPDVWFEMLRV